MFNFFNLCGKKISPTQKYKYTNFNLENICGEFFIDSIDSENTVTVIVPIKLQLYNMLSENEIDLNSSSNPNKNIKLNKIKV